VIYINTWYGKGCIMYREILEQNKDLNQHYFKRYLKFINKYNNINKFETHKTEKHHILPVSLYPEFKDLKKFKWNKIVLTLRQHFIAHWLLAKLYGGSQWFSFNQMKRFGGTSVLYEYGRKYIIEQLIITNTGIIKTEENRKGISERTKNTVVVKDKEGNRYRVSCDDERYINGELVYYRTGIKHSIETKEKMKKNNGLKGKKPFVENNKIIYYYEEEGKSKGLEIGFTDVRNKKMANSMSKLIWVTYKNTLKYKRIKKEDFNENLYDLGRVGFKGFKHINDKRKNETIK